MRTIGLEEHFVTAQMDALTGGSQDLAAPDAWREANRRLYDLADGRIAEMDAAGLDVQVLSLTTPGVQGEPDAGVAVDAAKKLNELIAATVQAHPNRFGGFAVLALQNPEAAADELERAVTQLGLCGALVNGHSQGRYLDDPKLRVVWERAEALDVPLYLHPGYSVDTPDVFSGHAELIGPMWSWGPDTAAHALRLVFSGVFDEFPRAKLILGHMGEALPYSLWRLDSRWGFHNHRGIELALGQPSEYLRRNLYVTTSGVCDAAPLLCAMLALGADHILFATDYPYEDMGVATEFLRNAPISEPDRAKIAHGNAERLLKIESAAAEGDLR